MSLKHSDPSGEGGGGGEEVFSVFFPTAPVVRV